MTVMAKYLLVPVNLSGLILLPRYLHLLCTTSFKAAQQQVTAIFSSLTTVDATRDFNQNKWLGVEIGHTLLYFDEKTPINHLLSVLGCVRGGSCIVLAYPSSISHSYFRSQIFLPALQCHNESLSILALKTNSKTTENAAFTLSHTDNKILDKLNDATPITHLIGYRGTGKSSLLGCYIRQQITNGKTVILSAPSLKSAANTMRQIGKISADVSRETFAFYPPNQLKKNADNADMIIIDEAASLAKQFIENVVQQARNNQQQLILSTTVEGYEGTGQSYRLHHLNSHTDTLIELTEPKRFTPDDALHRFCLSLCHPQPQQTTVPNGVYLFNTQQLRQHHVVQSCYALLQQAHYKTTPNDLARFYDNEALTAICVQDNHVVGAAHCHIEQLPNDLSPLAIYRGLRRAKDAFTQQAIIQAYGDVANISTAKILRIDRIAVDKHHRRQGIATALIAQIKSRAKWQYDFLSTSFSLTVDNQCFWRAQQFNAVRLGLYPNKWLNRRALLMLCPLNLTAEQSIVPLQAHFARHLSHYNDCASVIVEDSHTHVTGNVADIKISIDSVVNYHRDIHWLLPELADFNRQHHVINDTELLQWLDGKRLDKAQIKGVTQRIGEIRLDELPHVDE